MLPRYLLLALTLIAAAVPATELKVEVLENRLAHPWSLAFLPGDEGILITLRDGQLKRWQPGRGLSEPITGVPKVWAQAQGGLLDVVLAPDFTSSRRVWLSFSEVGKDGKAGTAVGYGRLRDNARQLDGFKVVFRQQPKLSTGQHFGGRMVFDKQGYLYIALGENNQRATAQALDKHQGKVVRLTQDGDIPRDNPLSAANGARPEIWAWGIRNPQGIALNPWNGQLWLHEHGPRGGDEINRVEAGKNYGWPIASWGINYSGSPIPEARGGKVAGTVQPLFYWRVSPAVSGMAFYNADTFPQWKHRLFVGALKQRTLIQLAVQGETITEEARLLRKRNKRVRDVRVGPDGYLYVLTDEAQGELLRLSPAEKA